MALANWNYKGSKIHTTNPVTDFKFGDSTSNFLDKMVDMKTREEEINQKRRDLKLRQDKVDNYQKGRDAIADAQYSVDRADKEKLNTLIYGTPEYRKRKQELEAFKLENEDMKLNTDRMKVKYEQSHDGMTRKEVMAEKKKQIAQNDAIEALQADLNIKDTEEVTVKDMDNVVSSDMSADKSKNIGDSINNKLLKLQNDKPKPFDFSKDEQAIQAKIEQLSAGAGANKNSNKIELLKKELADKFNKRKGYEESHWYTSTPKSKAEKEYDVWFKNNSSYRITNGSSTPTRVLNKNYNKEELAKLEDNIKNNPYQEAMSYSDIASDYGKNKMSVKQYEARRKAIVDEGLKTFDKNLIKQYGTKKVTRAIPIEKQLQELDELRVKAIKQGSTPSFNEVASAIEGSGSYTQNNIPANGRKATSAYGKYQMTSATTKDIAKQLGVSEASLKTPKGQEKAMKYLEQSNEKIITKLGQPTDNYNKYAIHQLGAGRYSRLVNGTMVESKDKQALLNNLGSNYKFTTMEKAVRDWESKFKTRVASAERKLSKAPRINKSYLSLIEKKKAELIKENDNKLKAEKAKAIRYQADTVAKSKDKKSQLVAIAKAKRQFEANHTAAKYEAYKKLAVENGTDTSKIPSLSEWYQGEYAKAFKK
jgi:hypothetical protein